MVKEPSVLSKKNIGHLRNINFTRIKLESLFERDLLVRRDIEQVYKGLFLDMFSSFENFLEDLILGLLMEKYKFNSDKLKPKIKITTYKIARIMLFGGRSYFDWLPINNTFKKVKNFFYYNNHFKKLTETDKRYLSEMVIIRNALAHKSFHSKNEFKKKIIDNQNLLPVHKTPEGFLRHVYRYNPEETRFEFYLNTISSIMAKLTS